jgi:hypothetical protein
MRRYSVVFTSTIVILLNACNNSNTAVKIVPVGTDTTSLKERPNFFPVTAYLKGQIYYIKERGITPIKYTTINNHTDSVMIKFEQLDGLLTEFLEPVIDSANLTDIYTETKFLDQTIGAFTFTYDVKKQLPDSLQLLHWDVYVDEETGKVKRIYMVKKSPGNKTLQLTWLNNQWSSITTIGLKPDGTTTVEKEEKISWDY